MNITCCPAELAPVLDAARTAADEVDRDARFPAEAVDAMRVAGLLSCSLPPELGGRGVGIRELTSIARAVGAVCSSAGMVFAMHHSQAITLGRHVDPATPLGARVAALAAREALLASATTELATGGDVGTSSCAVDSDGDRVRVTKLAPVVSYGLQADAVLVTARRSLDAAAGDQVIVFAERDGITMEQTGEWNTVGFRGTCSPGFRLELDVPLDNVLATPYAEISAQTMLPGSHTLWAATWLGIADAAVAKARDAARAAARRAPGDTVVPAVSGYADLLTLHQEYVSYVRAEIERFAALVDRGGESTVAFALAMNNLKISASLQVIEVVTAALRLCGINGYRLDHPLTMGRLLRDAFGPQLMVSNDRIRSNNARLALGYRG